MSVPRSRLVIRVLFAVAMLFLPIMVGRAQTGYTYTVIANPTDCSSIGAPVLSENGEVAYWSDCNSAIAIQRGDGGPLTNIHTYVRGTAGGYVPDHPISINDVETVAFRARDSQSIRQLILTGNGSGITPVVDTEIHTAYKEILWPAINDSGAVAFMADTDGSQGYDSIVVVNGGNFVTVAAPGTSSSAGPLIAAGYPGRLNSNGVVTFIGQLDLIFGVFTGSGGPLTTIALGGSESAVNSINTSGRVSFVGIQGNQYAVQTSQGDGSNTIATNADGYLNLNQTAINDFDRVAFGAMLSSGQTGIFTGPDPDSDAVIKSGDLLPGLGVVAQVGQITPEALNNLGQVAFGVTYDEGNGVLKYAIVRADPPNNPPVASDFGVKVAAGGSVSSALLATDPDGEPLTYAIVNNGTEGTAVVTDASTGAFTYTADAAGGKSSDSFTFQAIDIRGLASNVATVTVAISRPPTCAVDVTASITSKKPSSKNGGTTHRLSLTNTSTPIAGPVSLALDSLSPAWTLVNAAGVTSCTQPSGSPYVNVDVGADSIWSTGEQVEVILEFSLGSSGPGKKPALSYDRRVLAGTGGR